MNQNNIELLNKYLISIKEEIKSKIFTFLNTYEFNLLYDYYIKLVIYIYIHINKSSNIKDYIKQLELNNSRDKKAIINLLLPQINDMNGTYILHKKIKYLKDICTYIENNEYNISNIQYDRAYLLDKNKHLDYEYSIKDIEHNYKLLLDTIDIISCKLYINWTNIVPILRNKYKETELYKNSFEYDGKRNNFIGKNIDGSEIELLEYYESEENIEKYRDKYMGLNWLNYINMIHNDLYLSIYQIKWIFYELEIINKNSNIAIEKPKNYLQYIGKFINLKQIYKNNNWFLLNEKEQDKFKKDFDLMYINLSNNINTFKILYIFLFNFEKNIFNLNILKESYNYISILSYIKTLYRQIDNNNLIVDEENIDFVELVNRHNIVEKINNEIKKIPSYMIYQFIVKILIDLDNSWYGKHMLNKKALDNDKIEFINNEVPTYKKISDEVINDNLYDSMINNDEIINDYYNTKLYNKNKKFCYYISYKNIYNFAKKASTLYDTVYNENRKGLILGEMIPKWNGLDLSIIGYIITLLLGQNTNTVSIKRYIEYTYNYETNNKYLIEAKYIIEENSQYIRLCYKIFMNYILNSLKDIIFECLIFRGLLSEYNNNIELLDNNLTYRYFENMGKKYNKENVKLIEENSYYYLTNKPYKELNKIQKSENNYTTFFELLKTEYKWPRSYAMDWISQIAFYHHYINNRVVMITGATGVGKSTQIPKLYLYSLKMIDNNYIGKVACSVPRIMPVKSNAKQISWELGVPIFEKSSIYNEIITTDNAYIQYKTKEDSHIIKTNEYFLRIITDGTLLQEVINSPLIKTVGVNKLYNAKKGNEFETYLQDNIYDVLIIDESHEHNKNMDIILTLMRYGLYWNNSLKLIIVSATMTEDEPIYRRYYLDINDNMMFPLNLFNSTIVLKNNDSLDRNNVDRRIHISPPGETTQHKVIEEYLINDTTSYEEAEEQGLKQLYKLIEKKALGDILFFSISENDIIKLVKEINSKTPSNVIALPFYAKLPEYWKEIAEKTYIVYKEFNINKNEIFEEIKSKGSASKVSAGTYNQVIVVATNVAEASITIVNLRHVIDTGYYYSIRYDALTKGQIVEKAKITESSRLQRKGRVGRVASGNVYYMYKKGSREEIKPSYNICNDDIKNELFKLLRKDNDEDLFIRNEYLNLDINKLKEFSYINNHKIKNSLLSDDRLFFYKLDQIKTDNKIVKDLYESIYNIMNYQYLINLSDGKKLRFIYYGKNYDFNNFYKPPDRFITGYDLFTVIDIFGSFYIINPCEDLFYRHNLTGINDIYYNYKNNKFNDDSIKKIFSYIADLFYSRMIIPNKKLLNDISIKSFSRFDIIDKIIFDINKYQGKFKFLIDENNNDIFSKTSFSDKLLKLMDIIELDQDKSDSTVQNYLLAIIYGNILDINNEICQTVASLLAFGNDLSQLNPILYKNPYKQFVNKNNYGDVITFYNIFKKFYNDFKHLDLWDDTTDDTIFDVKYKIDLQKYNEIKLKMINNYSKNYDIMKDVSFSDNFNFFDFLELQKIDQKNNLDQEIGRNNYLTFKKSKIKKKISDYNAIEIIKWAKLRNLELSNIISMIKKYKIIKSKVSLNMKHLEWFKNNMSFNKELILEENIVKCFLFSYIQNIGVHHNGNLIEHITLTSMGKFPFKKFGFIPNRFVFFMKFEKNTAVNINNVKVKWLFEFIPDILLTDVIKIYKKEDTYIVIDLINHYNKINFIKKGNNELTRYLLKFI